MSRLQMSGVEWNTLDEFDSVDANVGIESTIVRSGNYALNFTLNSTVGVYANLAPGIAEGYLRVAVYRAAGGLVAPEVLTWYNGATKMGYILLDADKPAIYIDGSLKATAASAFASGTWHYIDVRVKIADAPNGIVHVLVDGVSVVSWSGDTRAGFSTLDKVRFGATSSTGKYYLDDMAINDTNGTKNNSWCGSGKIELLAPNGAGSNTEWNVSGAGSNWEAVGDNELPPDASDYVLTDAIGEKDTYNIEDAPSVSSIQAVALSDWLLKSSGATPQNVKQMIVSGVTTSFGKTVTPSTSFKHYQSVWDEDPDTGLPWTKAMIDALEIGRESAT
jgi:hypothetical protein